MRATKLTDNGTFPFADLPGYEGCEELTGVELSISGYLGRMGEGRTPIDDVPGDISPERQRRQWSRLRFR